MATELGLRTWIQQLLQSQQNHRHHQQPPSSGGWMFLYPTKQDQFQDESWEVKAFEEDKNSIMGSTWPPRSYTCTFCRREFRSAQALGGHMNVHRRDRAKLHESQPQPSLHKTYQTHAPTMSNTIGSSGTINFSLMDSYSTGDSSKIESSSMFTENCFSRRDLANDDDDEEIDLELRLGHKSSTA